MSRVQPSVPLARNVVLMLFALSFTACRQEPDAPPAPVRKVRTTTVEAAQTSPPIVFTGHVEAQDRAALAFRISGRMSERAVATGTAVRQGEVLARIAPENELNQLRSARAHLGAAESERRRAENQVQRLRHLLERDVASKADFETAEQEAIAARANVDAAKARVRSAEEFVAFTVLKADAPGIVTRIGAEPGEVVAAGRMIVELARREGRDAIFEIPEEHVVRMVPDTTTVVALGTDPAIKAEGRVREVAPAADAVTRTFRVKVGLTDPPPAFRLGTAVTGTISGEDVAAIAIPAGAVARSGADTSVWIVDAQALTVSRRKIELLGTDPATALVSKGLASGDIVVTAGVGVLRDGQKVRLAGAETR
jgi:RND family efflux transporter MFP subunit